MQRLVSLIPVLLFAAVSTALGFSLTNDPRRMPSMLIDKPAPEFVLPPLGTRECGPCQGGPAGNGVAAQCLRIMVPRLPRRAPHAHASGSRRRRSDLWRELEG